VGYGGNHRKIFCYVEFCYGHRNRNRKITRLRIHSISSISVDQLLALVPFNNIKILMNEIEVALTKPVSGFASVKVHSASKTCILFS